MFYDFSLVSSSRIARISPLFLFALSSFFWNPINIFEGKETLMINWESVSHIMFTLGFIWGRGWVIHDQICLGKLSSKQNKAFNMVIYVWESERWGNISGSTFIFLTYFTTGSTFTDHLAGPVFQVLHFGKCWGSGKRAPPFSLRDVAEANLRENGFSELIFFLNVTCGNPRDKVLSTNALTLAEHILKSGIFPF